MPRFSCCLIMSDPNPHPRWNSPHEMRHFVTPRAEPNANFTPLRCFGAQASAAEVEVSELIDPLIQALFDRLPKRNGEWTLDDRAKWLRTAASIFCLVYKASVGEDREIGVVLAANSVVTPLGTTETICPGFIGQ